MFDNRVIEVKLFADMNPKDPWPQAYSEDEGERVLSLWLERNQKALAAGSLSAEQRAKLDAELPGWCGADLAVDADILAARRELTLAGRLADFAGLL